MRFALLMGLLASCNPARVQSTAPPIFRPELTSPSLPGEPLSPVTYSGIVVARQVVELSAAVPGRIDHLAVRIGQTLRPKELVASLDTRVLRSALQVEQAQLVSAQAEEQRLVLVHAQAAAYALRLHSGDLQAFAALDIEKADYGEKITAAQLDVGRASVTEHQARVEALRVQLDQGELRAPFAGTIAVRYVDAGTLVQSGTPIVRLISSNDLLIRFALPESEAARLTLDEHVRVLSGQTLPTAADPPGEAAVERWAPEVDVATRRVMVEARLLGALSPSAPRAGSYVRILLLLPKKPERAEHAAMILVKEEQP